MAENTGTQTRTGTITVQGQIYNINQTGIPCDYSINPDSSVFTQVGGTGSFNVTAPAGCDWTPSKSATWITLTSGADSGNGTVTYNVAENTSMQSRSTVITTQGQIHTIAESAVSCNINSISNTPENTDATYEACVTLSVGHEFTVENNVTINLSSGNQIRFLPGLLIEYGAVLKAEVCGQSLCETSASPMPYGCHSCVKQICDIDPACCNDHFDQSCLDKVATICKLTCD